MAVIAGDIAFLGINSTNPDQFAILAVNAIAAGDSFFVTDGGFTGSNTGVVNTTFRGTEGFLEYTAPAGGIAAGSVLLFVAGDGIPANASVTRNGGGAAGTVALLTNGTNATNFSFSTSGDQLTAYTVSSGTYLTGNPVLVAFIDVATNPYGAGSAQLSSIPTITGGQVLDLINVDNAIFTSAATASVQTIAALSNAANFSTRETTAYDLTTLTSSGAATTATLSISAIGTAEGNLGTSVMTFTVARTDINNAFTVDVTTADGTATGGSDYVANTATLTFTAGGALTQSFTVTINGDAVIEPNETFAVNLSNVVATVGGATIGTQGIGTINNDDTDGTSGPDAIIGTAGDDTINALAGNDTITGGAGNDTITGGAGTDVAVVPGNRTAATITNTGLGSWTVTTAAGGTDTLTQTEILRFDDGDFGGANLTQNQGIDLSTYVLTGRFALPNPTNATPPPNSVLAQEASGVAYNTATNTLFIVGDGGRAITEVSLTGALVSSMTMALGGSPQGTEFYDPEGIAYVGQGQFVFTEERDRQLVQFTYVPGATLTRADTQTVKLGTTIGNVGFEGLSYDPQTNGFIVVKEISPIGIFQTTVDFAAGTASNGSPTATGSTNLFDPALLGLTDVADVFALSNLVTLNGQTQSGNLLVLSQEDGRIVNVTRDGTITSSLNIVSPPGVTISVADIQHEGLTVGPDGTLYVVNENGGGGIDFPQLWVFRPASAPNVAPTGLTLVNQVNSLAENTGTASRLKVADISITDDGLGTNTLALSGADAAFFEFDSSSLYIKAGTVLDFEAKPTYAVTLTVDDTTLGATPDASAAFTLNLTDIVNETPPPASIFISEVVPWSSGNSPVGADWFELTNGGTTTVDITGWRVDDNSNAFANSLLLNGITSIAPGESVVFIESASPATITATFINNWFAGVAPANFRLGTYTGGGIGLGTGGDAVNIYDAGGTLRANVTFGASTTGLTFDNAAGANAVAIGTLSVAGTNGAFVAVNSAAEVGSPGRIANANPQLVPGGTGDDTLTSGPLAELLIGGTGNDNLNAGAGDDTVGGGAGNDSLDGGTGNDTVSYAGITGNLLVTLSVQGATQDTGAAGIDFLSDFENLTGGSGSDVLGGSSASNVIDGGDGNDVIIAVSGNDTLIGGTGNDTLYGGTGNDSMAGGAGDDVYVVEDFLDQTVEAVGAGFDIAFVVRNGWTQGANVEVSYLYDTATSVTGSAGDDNLVANLSLNSTLNGANGIDTLWGQGGNDTLNGGSGNDIARGGAGNDSLLGGAGNDQHVGGTGADLFAYNTGSWGYDQIFDFDVAEGDKLDFRGSGLTFDQLGFQSLGGSTVVFVGAGADRIDVYNVASLAQSDFLFV